MFLKSIIRSSKEQIYTAPGCFNGSDMEKLNAAVPNVQKETGAYAQAEENPEPEEISGFPSCRFKYKDQII